MMGINSYFPLILALLSIMVPTCSRDGSTAGDDAGADADTDSDSDIDADGDTDSDADLVCDTDCPDVAWATVAGGTFLMGDTTNPNAMPEHEVTVPSFEMMRTEVTVVQYEACVEASVCTEPATDAWCNWGESGYEHHPVNCVSWLQAEAFCSWIGARLPSESEWEHAASNGDAEHEYPWGDSVATCNYAVMDDNSHDEGCDTGRTWEPCLKTAGYTMHDLCDMAGNVAEWVQDWWHADYSGAPTNGSAWEDPADADRTFRGGSFTGIAYTLAANYRRHAEPSGQWHSNGFRCAR